MSHVHFRFQHVVIPPRLHDFNSHETSPFILPKVFVTGGKNEIQIGIKNAYIFNNNDTSRSPDLPKGFFGATSILYVQQYTYLSHVVAKKTDGEITSGCFQFTGKI